MGVYSIHVGRRTGVNPPAFFCYCAGPWADVDILNGREHFHKSRIMILMLSFCFVAVA